MFPSRPPYSLKVPRFRFPALAAAAGRAPIGARRGAALASFVVARLADDSVGPRALDQEARVARGTAARSWLASMTLPALQRAAFVAVVSESESPTPQPADALRRLVAALGDHLEPAGSAELTRLAARLDTEIIAGA